VLSASSCQGTDGCEGQEREAGGLGNLGHDQIVGHGAATDEKLDLVIAGGEDFRGRESVIGPLVACFTRVRNKASPIDKNAVGCIKLNGGFMKIMACRIRLDKLISRPPRDLEAPGVDGGKGLVEKDVLGAPDSDGAVNGAIPRNDGVAFMNQVGIAGKSVDPRIWDTRRKVTGGRGWGGSVFERTVHDQGGSSGLGNDGKQEERNYFFH